MTKRLACIGFSIGAGWFTHTHEYGLAVYWGLTAIIIAVDKYGVK